jgi:hypothetical protein
MGFLGNDESREPGARPERRFGCHDASAAHAFRPRDRQHVSETPFMRVRSALESERALYKLSCRHVLLNLGIVDKLRRQRDVGDEDLARIFRARVEKKPELRESHRYRQIRSDRRTENFAGRRAYPARYVERKGLFRVGVEAIDEFVY